MENLKFKATDEQVKQIGANAINASSPVGIGHFQFNGYKKYSPSDFKITAPMEDLHLDYVGGRMVKLNLWKRGEHWEMRDQADPEYQSWCRKYPSATDLLKSVPGVEIITHQVPLTTKETV